MLWKLLFLLALIHQGSLQETPEEGSDCTTKEEIAQLTRDVECIKRTTREWQNATLHVFRDYIIQQRELQRILEPIASTIQATEQCLQELKAEIQQVQRSLLHAENTTARLQEDVDNLKHGTVFASCSHVARENPTNPSGYYFVYDGTGHPTRVYCDMHTHCNISGGWMRAAFLNMSDPGHQCPLAWREITRSEEPRRTCGRTNEGGRRDGGCSSAVFPSNGTEYRHVCGRILGYQYGTPNAFNLYNHDNSATIDSYYLDGVSVTHGNPRQHVWSFVAPYDEQRTGIFTCPCSNTNNTATIAIPPYVGQDYFCEAGVDEYDFRILFYAEDPLWDGENCGPTSTCCELNNPPWFCKQLPEPTTDDIEVRICANQPSRYEDTPIELIEIYVQ